MFEWQKANNTAKQNTKSAKRKLNEESGKPPSSSLCFDSISAGAKTFYPHQLFLPLQEGDFGLGLSGVVAVLLFGGGLPAPVSAHSGRAHLLQRLLVVFALL